MKKVVVFFTILFTLAFGSLSYAHSGRTDSSGGHNCSDKSKAKGLCTGYHYHNGGGPTSSGDNGSSGAVVNTDKDCTDFASYEEVVAYWNAKGYSATYDPENLDGWGNGKVDDGIPCEPPYGYDKTLVNNSPEQQQHKQEEQDMAKGEKNGYPVGKKNGYAAATRNNANSTGSEAYRVGFAKGYDKGYDEGKAKLESEKVKASEQGSALGKKQDKLVIPAAYSSNSVLKQTFEDAFKKAVNERVEAKKKEFNEKGYTDGKKDLLNLPTNVEDIYINAYREGYDTAQEELKKEYTKMGYDAAFTILKYEQPKLNNDKFRDWYKQGFESNKEIDQITEAAYQLGKEGEGLKIPSKYKKAEPIFKHHYQLGYQEYEDKQNKLIMTGGVGAGVLALVGGGWYSFRRKRNTEK